MEHQMPCSSSAVDNSPFQLIEIEDDFPVSPVPPEQENLVESLVDTDTSGEQEATNASLTRPVDEHEVSEGEIQAKSTLISAPGGNKRKTPYSIKFDELPETVRKFLASVKKFFTQKVNFEREKAPVALSTYDKAQERMLCFLGYVKTTLARDAQLLPECFMRIPLIEGYVAFLKEERNCSSATVSNHLSSLLYPIKFVHKEDAPDFKGVQIIRQLRTQARILQKEGDLERPSTTEDLSAQNRWIPWEEVVSAVSKQREKFDLTGPMKFKAKEFCDLIMLSLYVFIPPARGLEIRTLEVLSGEQASNFDPKSSTGKNYLIVKDSGDIVLHFNNYKTRKFSGRDELALQPQDELCRLLLSYIKDYRPHIVTESSGRYLLLNKNGDHFTAASFSAHLKSVLYGLTGKLASINILRSSFITWAYDKSDCTDSLKVSLASALRHSRKQAQDTYDRRTSNQKKQMAVNLARNYAEGRLDEGEPATAAEPKEGDATVNRGDFVAVVSEESTYLKPVVFIGRVQSIGQKEATLLYYKHIGTNLYKLEFSVEEWKEDINSLVPVELQGTKKRAGVYKLLTSTRTIHKAVKG